MTRKSVVDAVVKRFKGMSGLTVAEKAYSLLSALLASVLILYSGYVLYDMMYTSNAAFGSAWGMLRYRPEIIEDDDVPLSASELASINEDYRAWLTLYDTNIDYPVMQGKDDLWYASHDIYGKTSLTGAIYLAASNSGDFSDAYNLTYGHHMDNRAMFGGIDLYAEGDYIDTHRRGILVTSDKVYDLDVFALIETSAYDDDVYVVSGKDIDDVLSTIRRKHVVMRIDRARGAKKILAMSTCESSETNGRRVLFAVMTERDLTTPVPPVPVIPELPTGDPVTTTTVATVQVIPTIPVAPTVPPTLANSTANPVQVPESIEDNGVPLTDFFQPTGSSYGWDAWALLNLICMLLTIYLFLPVLHLRAKYRRRRLMRDANEMKVGLAEGDEPEDDALLLEYERILHEAARIRRKARHGLAPLSESESEVTESDREEAVERLYWRQGRFGNRLHGGVVAEIIVSVVAVIAFILTEDIRLPMVIIDRWTPLMIFLLALCWIIDVRLIRYREGVEAEDRDDEDDDTSYGGDRYQQ